MNNVVAAAGLKEEIMMAGRLTRMATWKRADLGPAILIEVDGQPVVSLLHADLAAYPTVEELAAEVRRQVGESLNVFVHVNRDKSVAIACGAEPKLWPEDEDGRAI